MRRYDGMEKITAHLMNLRDSNPRPDLIDEAVEIAAGSTSLPIGSGIRDLISQMGDNREKILQIIQSGQTACLTIALITNNFGEMYDDLTRIEAHREMLKEQLEITQCAVKNGWEFGLFTKYIQLSKIQPLEDGQERFFSAPESMCLPSYRLRIQGFEVDQTEKQPIVDFLKAFNQKSPLFFKFACLGVTVSALSNEQIEGEIRAEVNRFLVFLHYILSVISKLSYQDRKLEVFAPTNLSDELEKLRLQYQQNDDLVISDRIAEAVYSVLLTVAPEKLLYSQHFIEHELERRANRIEKKYTDEMIDRLRYDHKFQTLYNSWCFSEWIEVDLNQLVGKYYVYSDIHNLALGSLFNNIRSIGNKTPLIALTNSFLKNETDPRAFIENAFFTRLQGEILISEYYGELGEYCFDENHSIPCFYVEVGDQVQGVVSDFNIAIRAFELARNKVGYRLKSGLGIVKIDGQASFAEVRRESEFGLDVTKLFKDYDRVWEKYQLFGEQFSYGKSVAVISKLRGKMGNIDANGKFLRRVYRNRDLWIHHCHPKFQDELEKAISEIHASVPDERI